MESIHIVDSFHIYGSYFDEFEGFLQTVRDRRLTDGVYAVDFGREFFIEGCDALLAEADMPAGKRALVEKRRELLVG